MELEKDHPSVGGTCVYVSHCLTVFSFRQLVDLSYVVLVQYSKLRKNGATVGRHRLVVRRRATWARQMAFGTVG